MSSTSTTEADAAARRPRLTPPGWSVAARITLGYAACAALLLVVVAATLDWSLSTTLDAEISKLAQNGCDELDDVVRESPGDPSELREEVLREGSSEGGMGRWMRVRDAAGTLVIETPGMAEAGLDSALFPAPRTTHESWGRGRAAVLPSGVPVRIFSGYLDRGPGDSAMGTVEIAVDYTATTRIRTQFRERLALVTMAGFLALLGVGYGVARRGLEPLRTIAASMQSVESSTLHRRVERSGLPQELWVLATAFNDVLGRLDASFLRLAQFSADIAHELRTPLARMRLAAELALRNRNDPKHDREALGECLEEAVKLSRLIDRLLFLARAEGPQSLARTDVVDMLTTLQTVAEFYRAPAEEAQIELTVDAEPGIVASVDRELLLQAIGNLVQNSLAYTSAGGAVRLTAAATDGQVEISVRDSGCGIPASDLPQLFDAFHRVDRARSTASGGTGLGMAIVQKIARLHGGEVHVASEVGVGTIVTLTFARGVVGAAKPGIDA